MALKRLKEKTTKDVLWIYILSLLKEKDMYAYEIRDEIYRKFGFKPARITSYVVLYRLEKEGFVNSYWKGDRKYYSINLKGKKLLDEGIKYLKGMIEKISGKPFN
jgi:DNA-binding PadR family transcriptional regulator